MSTEGKCPFPHQLFTKLRNYFISNEPPSDVEKRKKYPAEIEYLVRILKMLRIMPVEGELESLVKGAKYKSFGNVAKWYDAILDHKVSWRGKRPLSELIDLTKGLATAKIFENLLDDKTFQRLTSATRFEVFVQASSPNHPDHNKAQFHLEFYMKMLKFKVYFRNAIVQLAVHKFLGQSDFPLLKAKFTSKSFDEYWNIMKLFSKHLGREEVYKDQSKFLKIVEEEIHSGINLLNRDYTSYLEQLKINQKPPISRLEFVKMYKQVRIFVISDRENRNYRSTLYCPFFTN